MTLSSRDGSKPNSKCPDPGLFIGKKTGGVALSIVVGFVSFFSLLLAVYLFAPGLRETVEASYMTPIADYSDAESEKNRLSRERDLLRKAYLGTLRSCGSKTAEADSSAVFDLSGPLTVMEAAELEELEEQDKWRVAIPDEKPQTPVKPKEPQRRPAAAPAPAPTKPATPAPTHDDVIPPPKPVPPTEPSTPGPKKAPKIPPMAFPAADAK
jgi:hypothetical protein